MKCNQTNFLNQAFLCSSRLPVCGSGFGCPPDHHLSLPLLAHCIRAYLHTLQTAKPVIAQTSLVMPNPSYLPFSSFLILVLSLSQTVSGASTTYRRKLSIVGPEFFEQFNWESRDDPTHGRVNYLSLEEARAKNLAYGSSSFLRLAL